MKKRIIELTVLLFGLTLPACANVPHDPSESLTNSSEGTASETNSSEGTASETSESESFGSIQIDMEQLPLSTGVRIDDAGKNAFLEHLNSEIDIVSDLTALNTFSQPKNVDGSEINVLTLGSAKTVGSLTMNFTKQIKKIEIECQGYYKTYNYSGTDNWNYDSGKLLYIDGSEYSVDSVQESGPTEVFEFAKDYSEGTDTIVFATGETAPNRIFINSLTISW